MKKFRQLSHQLEEGRASQRHPLEGHEYHKKSNEALIHIAKDAHKAAEAMKGHNTDAENKYRDQANDSATVRYFRQKSGMPDWYKKKYGHMKEEVDTPPIHVRSLYTQTYAKHGGTIQSAKSASEKAYAAVEKKHGTEMRDKLQAFHARNMNEETDTTEKVEMVQSQLHFIKYACEEILDYIEEGGEVEEWYQVKVAKSFSEFESLHAFIEGESRRTGMKEESEQIDEMISNDDKSSIALRGLTAKQNLKKTEGKVKSVDFLKKMKDRVKAAEDLKKEEKEPPFEGGKPRKGVVTDKSGAKHGTMSKVRDIARQALKKQSEKMKPVKESLDESRKTEIVKDAVKSAKDKKTESKGKEKFESDPILSSEIMKETK